MYTPLSISICIPTYNAAETLEMCLESIFNQTIQPFEVVIVDGSSHDETIKILKKYPSIK
ncbi:MAG: glycosyltransferase family 2 protein, partial [Candidatus Hodarchaeota archaeon]